MHKPTASSQTFVLYNKTNNLVLDPCSHNIFDAYNDIQILKSAGLTFTSAYIEDASKHAKQIISPKFTVYALD